MCRSHKRSQIDGETMHRRLAEVINKTKAINWTLISIGIGLCIVQFLGGKS